MDDQPRHTQPRQLVLWDIDHTLIETRGVGRDLYYRAFHDATGRQLDKLADVTGRTELDIMAETLSVNGIKPDGDAVAALGQALRHHYNLAREELGRRGRALPGAHDVLAALAQHPSTYQSVLTGNLRDVAAIKLDVFDLATHLDLDAGAYGEDGHERSALVAVAQQRAATQTSEHFSNDHTVLIGDTPNDVRAGIEAGVRVIGIATGKSTKADLHAAGATRTLADLRHVDQLLNALGLTLDARLPENGE